MSLKDGLKSLEDWTQTTSGTDVFMTGSIVGLRVNDGNGALFSVGFGSPITYSAKILAGSVATSAGSLATIVFGAQFTNPSYYIVAQPINGSGNFFISGALRASGCELVGNASTDYHYIAVGL